MIVRHAAAVERKRTFLACRYMLILAVTGILLAEAGREAPPLLVAAFIITAVASNLVLSRVSPFSFFDAEFQAPMLVADTAMICFGLLLSGSSHEMFIFFFFVLIAAAKIENLVVLAIAAGAIGLASYLLLDPTGTTTLMRVPFLFAVGVFFGYVVLPERTKGSMPPQGARSVSRDGGGLQPRQAEAAAEPTI